MMSRKYVLIPVLVTLVVLAVALYPTTNVTQRASAAPRAAVVTKYLMIPAAAFIAWDDGLDYYNWGHMAGLSSGSGGFVAPVYLPRGARIRMIKLFAYDANASYNFCAWLYENHPKVAGGETYIEKACTTGSSGYQQPTKYLSHYVKWYYGYYVNLWYGASSDQYTTAVMIKYTVNQ
jgi:hypothetical protein